MMAIPERSIFNDCPIKNTWENIDVVEANGRTICTASGSCPRVELDLFEVSIDTSAEHEIEGEAKKRAKSLLESRFAGICQDCVYFRPESNANVAELAS